MRPRGRRRLTLANRLLLLAALIVVVTTVLLIATSAVGVYEMAERQEATRQEAYRDIVVAELSGRLNGASQVTRTTADEPAFVANDAQAWRRVLMNSAVENAPYLEGFALIDQNGAVLSAWPASVTDEDLPAASGLFQASAARPGVVWNSVPGDPGGTLWATARVSGRAPSDRVLVGKVRTEFITDVLTDIAESGEGMLTVIFAADGLPIYVGGDAAPVSSGTFDFVADETDPSRGALSLESTTTFRGFYATVTAPTGLDWRVGILGPEERALRQTWAALRPGVWGWVVALVVALVASLAVVSRVTQPITELERRARALASGARLEPETVDQHDEIGRLLESFNSIERRVNRLSDIAELLAAASDSSLVLEGVTASIAHMLGTVDVDVLLLADGDRLELVAAQGALDGEQGSSVDLADVPWVAGAIVDGEPVAVSGIDDAFLLRHGGSGSASALVSPLRAGTDIIGVVVVVRPGGGAFTDAESETVRSFAAQASVALQNARLFDEERRSRREAEALRAVAERVSSPLPADRALEDVGRMLADLAGFSDSVAVLRDRSAYGLPPLAEGRPVDVWFEAFDRLSDLDRPGDAVAVDGAAGGHAVAEALARAGAASALLVPVLQDETVAALLVLLSSDDSPVLSPRRRSLVLTGAKQASLALQNAYLYEQARSRADNLETIFRISHAVGSSLQSRVVLNRVLDVVQKILSADAVMLMTYDSQRKVIGVPMARGILHRDMLEATFRPGEDVPGRVFETREPERFDRISRADTRLLNAAAAQGLESLLAVPLLARGRSIGVLVVFARAQAAFSSDELDLLRTFASQAALAIDTADMFSREHQVASVLKESIQPTRLPHVTGIDAAQVYLPAGTEADIGGDYYDMFLAPDGGVVAAIGDVCGKGVAAATKTSMIKYAVRGMVAAGLGPSRILQEINRMLSETGDPSNIVTLWLGYLGPKKDRLLYANGGHPPALLMHPDGAIERLATTGALLGAVPDADWSEHSLTIGSGDTLLLYTDGVTEARNGSRFFGEGRVRRSLRKGGSADAVVQRLFALVQRFSGGELRDDAALLALVVEPEDGEAAGVSAVAAGGM